MRIRHYTATVIQIFKIYTVTRIRCYIGIISHTATDSYRMNKTDYGLRLFIESSYNDIRVSYRNIQKIYRNIMFHIRPYFIWIRENKVQKKNLFTVVLCSDLLPTSKLSIQFICFSFLSTFHFILFQILGIKSKFYRGMVNFQIH